jgi:hypothetical protein
MLMATAVASADPVLAVNAPHVTEVTDRDVLAIRRLVRDQLAAFRAGDSPRAFEMCTEAIRSTFAEAGELMSTIESNYPALVAPRQLHFGDFLITPDGLAVLLFLVGEDLITREALYLVQRDEVGSWRVNGCMMTEEAQAQAA